MPAILSPSAKQQFFFNDGTFAAGGRLYTYAANTTTPQATYLDRAGAVPNTNPIILDARGEAIIYLTPGVVYDYVLKTEDDALVWTREDVIADAGVANAVIFIQAGTGAVNRTVQDKQREWLTPYDFGAVGDGVADDGPALVAADTAAFAQGKSVRIPYGTFLVNSALTSLKASWFGEKGHLIKASGTLVLNGPSMLEWAAGSDGVTVKGLVVDFNNRTCTIGSEAVIGVAASDDVTIEDCIVTNMIGAGIAGNGIRNFSISGNTIRRAAFSNSYNQAILVSSASRQANNGEIKGNTCINSAINIAVFNCLVDNNDVDGWGFGAGVTTEQDTADSANNIITNNRLRNSQGIDTNLTRPMGIENWAPNSVISNNVCWDNSGSGIDNGGKNTRVTDNVCYNNGKTAATAGIVSRYGDATYNASGSSYSGNKCFDTQGTKTQTTGYTEQSASLAGISIRGNQFNDGVGVTPENIVSASADYTGPALEFSQAWDPASIANGTMTSLDVTCGGASLGDYVIASVNADLTGLVLSASVKATNVVTLVLANVTGGARDLGNATYRIRVQKPKNYSLF